MKPIKRITIATIVVLIFLVTNPSYNKFKGYSKNIPIKGIYVNTKKTFNGFIFSIYKKETAYTNGGDDDPIESITTIKYLGLLSNFFKISEVSTKVGGNNILK